ncbi:zinc finger, GRF-type containing protein [Tanacetum coccineum]
MLSEAQGVSLRITSGVTDLRVADSHTGNHPEDDFTPLETIRRSNSTIGKKITFELEGEAFELGRRYKAQNYKMVVRCACGLEAVIRISWTKWNPGRHFYGCPTLSPTCVNFLRWYDPPMCQREVAFLLDVLSRRAIIEELERLPGNLVAYKTREHLKRIQKAVLVEVIELKKELCLQVPP